MLLQRAHARGIFLPRECQRSAGRCYALLFERSRLERKTEQICPNLDVGVVDNLLVLFSIDLRVTLAGGGVL